MLPDFERADAIGSYWGNPETRTFAELLIDCEEDRSSGLCSSACSESGRNEGPSCPATS
jgi:hypothetical protein